MRPGLRIPPRRMVLAEPAPPRRLTSCR